MPDDPLATLRLFADMRQARLKLTGLDSPDVNRRIALIRKPEVHHALRVLLMAAEKLVAGPDEQALFWDPAREAYTVAEARFDRMKKELDNDPRRPATAEE